MKPYLIVLDLDGTLMLDFATYDDETFDYLRHLNQLGHLIMLATGRPKRSSYFVYKALNLHTPLINYNGAFISNPTDSNYPITDFRISKDDLLDIINYIRPYLINVFCEIIDDIYVQDYNEEIKPFLHIDGGVLHSGEIKDILPDNPNGALFFLKKEAIIDFVDYIKKNYSNQLLARYWEVNNVEMLSRFRTKGQQEKIKNIASYVLNMHVNIIIFPKKEPLQLVMVTMTLNY